jgi:hypothetical protein
MMQEETCVVCLSSYVVLRDSSDVSFCACSPTLIATLLRMFEEHKITRENAWDLSLVAVAEHLKIQASGKKGMAGVEFCLLLTSATGNDLFLNCKHCLTFVLYPTLLEQRK